LVPGDIGGKESNIMKLKDIPGIAIKAEKKVNLPEDLGFCEKGDCFSDTDYS
jgi:hypothetical protein